MFCDIIYYNHTHCFDTDDSDSGRMQDTRHMYDPSKWASLPSLSVADWSSSSQNVLWGTWRSWVWIVESFVLHIFTYYTFNNNVSLNHFLISVINFITVL